jgi:hypothetical protein
MNNRFCGIALVIFAILVFYHFGDRMIIESTKKSHSLAQEKILRGESTGHEVVIPCGITNWVVITNHPAPAGMIEVVTSGMDKFSNNVLAHGFSSKKIDPGTPVKFTWVTYSLIHGGGPNSVHFVEPLQ